MEETNGDGKELNKEGLYRHSGTGQEIWLEQTPPYGSPVIDAFIKAGFVYIGNEKPQVPEVVEPTEDVYTETTTKNGKVQYRLNGKLISKEQYDNKIN